MKNIPTKIIVHHTGGSDADPLSDSSSFTFKECDDLHKQRFDFMSTMGFYVGYHYYIDKYGVMTQARADDEEGAHTIGQNTSSLGVCLAGNFDLTLPTEAQVITLKAFLLDKMKQYNISAKDIYPHRKYAVKTCYGNKLSDDWASKLASAEANELTSNDIIKVDSKMKSILNFFDGKKTYLVAIVGLIYGIIHKDPQIIQTSLLGAFGRAAIAKIQ